MTDRYRVTHTDGALVECVRDLDLYTARRLVEHEQSAGRVASIEPELSGQGNGRYR